MKNGISHAFDETMSEESNEIETIGFSITDTNKGNIKVVCLYRAPDGNLCNFNAKMEQIRYKLRKKGVYSCGDYSIDLLKVSEHQDAKDLSDGMFTDGFTSLIQEATKMTKDSATAINNIFLIAKQRMEQWSYNPRYS